MDLSTSSNEIKVSLIQIRFRGLLSLKQVCCACFECICEAMLEQFVLVLFQIIIQNLVNFAVGYKYINLSKRGKNFPQAFFIISLSAKVMPSCVFHSACFFLLLFFPRALGGRDSQTSNQTLAKFSPFP